MEETDEPRISIPDSGIRDVSRDRQGGQLAGTGRAGKLKVSLSV